MKQTRLMKMLFVPAALSLFAACSSDNDIVGDKNPTEDKGITLTINAYAGSDAAMSRVQYNNDYSVEWTSADKVYAFAGSTANAGLCGITTTADKHNATLTVKLPTTPKNGDKITAYVANSSVTAVNAKTEGLGDQVEVDYSKQDGTYADATSRCVLFGETTYNSANPGELSMDFKYQTTFFKLSLNFPETVEGTAALYLTGDNIYTISRMNTTGANAGQLGNKNGFTITVPSVKVSAGQAKDIYIAMYPGQVQNVKLQAVMADGKTYEFNLGNANLAAGKVYNIKKNGTEVATVAATKLEGKGTPAEPYLINNLADLKYLQTEKGGGTNTKQKIYKMTNDIVINGSWTPFKSFYGTFDGDNHAILGNINITTPTSTGAGIFGEMGWNSTIKNLTNKANITAELSINNKTVGGIVGRINNTNVTIKNCVNLGIINSNTIVTGGIIGEIVGKAGTEIVIEACRNEGIINGKNINNGTKIGGIVGNINGNKVDQKIIIKGCSTKDVSFASSATTAVYTGGISGYIVNPKDADQIIITACWTSDLVFPTVGNKCGMVGAPATLTYTLNNCWTNASELVVKGSKATMNKCYLFKDKPFSEWVTEANEAWGSSEYEFNADGTINVK